MAHRRLWLPWLLAALAPLGPLRSQTPAGLPAQVATPATAEGAWPSLSGPYLGQRPPGTTPELFAPRLISTGMFERDLCIAPGGEWICYGQGTGRLVTLMETRLAGGRWTEPRAAPFASDARYNHLEPCLTPDGSKVLFLSTRPPRGKEPLPGWGHQNLWAAERKPDGTWGEAYDLGAPVNTEDDEFYPSLTRDGTLYFTRAPRGEFRPSIYRAPFREGKFLEPEPVPLPAEGGGRPYNAMVAPDESYLIACVTASEGTAQGARYLVFFRTEQGAWTPGIDPGPSMNLPGARPSSASLSPDGKVLFFGSTFRDASDFEAAGPLTRADLLRLHGSPRNGDSDIYWVDSAFIEALRPPKPEAPPAVAPR